MSSGECLDAEEEMAGPSGLSSGERDISTRKKNKFIPTRMKKSLMKTVSIPKETPVEKKRKTGEKVSVVGLSEQEIDGIIRTFSSDEEFSDDKESNDDNEIEEERPDVSMSGIRIQPLGKSTVIDASPEASLRHDHTPSASAFADPSATPLSSTSESVPQLHATPTIQWKVTPPSLPSVSFTGNPGLKIVPKSQTPLGYFELFFCDQFYELVLRETENFAEYMFLESPFQRSRISTWKTLEREEFKVWLGLLFHMGHIQISRLESYWRADKLYAIPIFAEKMSRDRFLTIMQALHFAENPGENAPKPADRLYKIRPLLDFFHERMGEIISPNKNLSLDESMILWRGRLIFRQYIKGKKHKFGIKMYMLTEHSGLVLRVHIYAGSGDVEVGGKGHSGKVVHSLLSDFKNIGHSVFMDNFYNSVDLSRELINEKTNTTETLRVNRKNNPQDVVNKKLKKGETVYRWSDDGVCVLKWRDRREVLLLSTEFGPEMVEVPSRKGTFKPHSVIEYNNFMGGIDHFDQLLSYYTCEHRTLKWYKKVGIRIFQVMLLNSYFLYKKYSGNKTTLHDFRHELVRSLLSVIEEPPTEKSTPVERHFPTPTPFSELGKKHRIQKRCRVCHNKGIKKMVTYMCPNCKDAPGLCIECFLEYNHE